ncbi:TFIIB-type zinc ribbon-containing protein [uncultured Demequina sp.]|uniref:TFIIB-type zinc ribbon-containing protein n=1 Tax=uncultured Demequina sp. TaxID=693499 RepID=UPI0025D68FDF|nr:TFIIB-type zinc ribbon-containing protein [uncultured Demequina sp.]
MPAQPEPQEPVREIDTTTGQGHGHDDCPQCGSTEVSRKGNTLSLICGFCRYEWVGSRLEDAHGLGAGIGELDGRTFLSGAADITSDQDLVTIKCQGCGSEVVIDTARALEARCHWCRSILSINDKIPNGAVPDGILPFHITKQEAMTRIAEFAGKRKFFALKKFRSEFKADNIMGVYMPYMTVDGNVTAVLKGAGEVQTRKYRVQTSKNSSTTYYDANVYDVARQFDLHIDDLIVESSAARSNIDNRANTNNIINAILPYDVKNMVAFDSNYMGDFSAEKRDLNIDDVARRAHAQFLGMARESIRDDIRSYDRGVRWTHEDMEVHGSRWASVFLPVWLYSYAQRQDDGSVMVHYIAVNGRNGNVMGSVPVNKGRLFAVAALVTAVAAVVAWPLGLAALAAG